ncbi:MAG: hypothetical protein K6T51_06955 [Rubrobacteraceae bacterium]|uniref:hypothetical protein n=1 Tax=Rubrobacter naiadicus TaxID=1392641 RepID=UPI00235F79CB|nr:hypothetical protein [Rubrobacter naiadicus]MCL6438331.1 hypothetical protein [Rubrobacteraceae bacterium]
MRRAGSILPHPCDAWLARSDFFGRMRRLFAQLRAPRRENGVYAGYRAGAKRAISELHERNAAVFERALRLSERAERLERSGTPSESACNRAARAREDALEALFELRTTFSAGVPEKARAFDEEARRIYPFLELP